MSTKRSKSQRRQLIAEALESRQLLTGQGIELPIASFAPPSDMELMPTSEGQISRAAIVDLNLDGQSDYAATSSGISGAAVTFFIADGNRFSSTKSDRISDNYFEDILDADINGDGYPDVVAAGEKAVYTYLNLGFSEDQVWLGMEPTPHEALKVTAQSLAAADLNGDGRDDLVMGTEQRVVVQLADSQAKFTTSIWYVTGPGSKAVATGDVNKDGFIDVVAAIAENETAAVLLNDGDGFMATSQTITDVIPSRKIKLLDVDGDEQLDLVAGGFNQEEANLLIWPGTDTGAFEMESSGYETIGAPQDFALGDVNEDGQLDIVVGHASTFHHPITNNGSGGVSVLLATSPGVFEDPIRISSPGASSVAVTQEANGPQIRAVRDYNNVVSKIAWQGNGIIDAARDYADELENPFGRRTSVHGDFNADGIKDFLVAEVFVENEGAQLYLGNAEGDYVVTSLAFGAGNRVDELFAGDFNGDNIDDLGVKLSVGSTSSIVSMLSNGDGTFQSPRTASLPESFANFKVVDANGDGRDDLIGIEAVSISTWIVTALADENGKWTAANDRLKLNNRFASELQIADFNQDNNMDVLATSFNQTAELALGTSDGSFAEATNIGLERSLYAVGDFNGDQMLDIAGANFSPLQLAIAYGSSDGTFDVQMRISLSEPIEATQGLQAIDAFSDGKSELVAFGNDVMHLLSANESGGFDVTEHKVGFFPGQVFALDVTGDANLDLVVSPPGMAFISSSPTLEVALLEGTAEGSFETPVSSAVSFIDGQVVDIQTVGDRLEFLVTHRSGFGKLVSTRPGSLPGDFNGDGAIDSDDIDLLCSAAHTNPLPISDIARFDQNSDNVIDAADVDIWLTNMAQSKRGDTDLDGDIDFADFLQLSANFGANEAVWSDGDFDCDGKVGFSDFLLLSLSFGK